MITCWKQSKSQTAGTSASLSAPCATVVLGGLQCGVRAMPLLMQPRRSVAVRPLLILLVLHLSPALASRRLPDTYNDITNGSAMLPY